MKVQEYMQQLRGALATIEQQMYELETLVARPEPQFQALAPTAAHMRTILDNSLVALANIDATLKTPTPENTAEAERLLVVLLLSVRDAMRDVRKILTSLDLYNRAA